MNELDKAACRYIAQQTKGKTPSQIVEFFARNLIFKNEGWLGRIVKEQKWKDDILEIRDQMAKV